MDRARSAFLTQHNFVPDLHVMTPCKPCEETNRQPAHPHGGVQRRGVRVQRHGLSEICWHQNRILLKAFARTHDSRAPCSAIEPEGDTAVLGSGARDPTALDPARFERRPLGRRRSARKTGLKEPTRGAMDVGRIKPDAALSEARNRGRRDGKPASLWYRLLLYLHVLQNVRCMHSYVPGPRHHSRRVTAATTVPLGVLVGLAGAA